MNALRSSEHSLAICQRPGGQSLEVQGIAAHLVGAAGVAQAPLLGDIWLHSIPGPDDAARVERNDVLLRDHSGLDEESDLLIDAHDPCRQLDLLRRVLREARGES